MQQIHVEVRPTGQQGDLSSRPTLPESFADRAAELGQAIAGIADRVRSHLTSDLDGDSAWRLGDVELSFSIDLEAEAGVIIARTKTAAAFAATVTFTRG